MVMIPDVVPELPERSDMSMTAGDFLDVYGQGDADGTWDAVVTSFFIDTAKNIVEYIERIRALLRPGGVWINNGTKMIMVALAYFYVQGRLYITTRIRMRYR